MRSTSAARSAAAPGVGRPCGRGRCRTRRARAGAPGARRRCVETGQDASIVHGDGHRRAFEQSRETRELALAEHVRRHEQVPKPASAIVSASPRVWHVRPAAPSQAAGGRSRCTCGSSRAGGSTSPSSSQRRLPAERFRPGGRGRRRAPVSPARAGSRRTRATASISTRIRRGARRRPSCAPDRAPRRTRGRRR